MPNGLPMLIGKPAQPMSAERREILSLMVFAAEEIIEAHVPMCFIPGHMSTSQEVLVVLLQEGCDQEMVMRNMSARLATVLSPEEEMLSFAVSPDSEVLAQIRATGCRLAPLSSS